MSGTVVRWLSGAMERGLIPDAATRYGIRRLCSERLKELAPEGAASRSAAISRFLAELKAAPVAVETAAANAQHYEVPAQFYEWALGPNLKYSGCYWPEGVATLVDAEAAALALIAERAGIENGQRILELGCGWGSLTLFLAQHFPGARIVAVSNSSSQREFILGRTQARGLGNIEVITCDMNRFAPEGVFDRVVSVEMFEHMRNWEDLFARVASWLLPQGKFFLHVFCHAQVPYIFEDRGPADWMARHFFTGGMMPHFGLPLELKDHLEVVESWRLDGTHYQKTADAWLANTDAHRDAVIALFDQVHGGDGQRWYHRWRIFFMACSELFGYASGSEWMVGHYLLRPR